MGKSDPHGVVIPDPYATQEERKWEKLPDPEPFPTSSPDAETIMSIMAGNADQCTIYVNGVGYCFAEGQLQEISPPTQPCKLRVIWEWNEKLKVAVDMADVETSAFSCGHLRLMVPYNSISYELTERTDKDPVALQSSSTTRIILIRYVAALEASTLVVLRGILHLC